MHDRLRSHHTTFLRQRPYLPLILRPSSPSAASGFSSSSIQPIQPQTSAAIIVQCQSTRARAPTQVQTHKGDYVQLYNVLFLFLFLSNGPDCADSDSHTHTHTCALVYISSLYLYRSVIINQAVQTHTCTQAGMHTHTYVHDTQACTHAQFPFF